MFVGSIQSPLRKFIYEVAPQWCDLPVYVGCSGNFVVERILLKAGIKEIHSCDVSLYTGILGEHLAGRKMSLKVTSDKHQWLEDYIQTSEEALATVTLLLDWSKCWGRSEPYFVQLDKATRENWDSLHSATVERIKTGLEGVRVTEYHNGDVMDFVSSSPNESVFISFPPTYKGGYEKLYSKVDELFDWPRPQYELFDDESNSKLFERAKEKRHWLIAVDREYPEHAEWHCGLFQTSPRMKPLWAYGNVKQTSLAMPHQNLEPVTAERLTGVISGPLEIVSLTQGQFNFLRSQYLSPNIAPASSLLRFAVTANGKLIGCFAVDRCSYGYADAYLMSDFAVSGTSYKRLSKLVLAAVLSKEAKLLMQRSMNGRVRTITTTAFTSKPVSMKYRGLFDVYNRADNHVNYIATAGQWSLEEGFDQWMKHHSNS